MRISIPVFQFILLRWYFRLFIWIRFLWRVSKLDLRLLPTHPDHAGGLGFLGESTSAFAPVLVAQSVLLSGTIAQRIFFQGAKLADFKLEIAGAVGLLLLLSWLRCLPSAATWPAPGDRGSTSTARSLADT